MDNISNEKIRQAVYGLLEAIHGTKDPTAISELIHGMLNDILTADDIPGDRGVRDISLPWSKIDHELRSPMNGILGFSTILLDELKDPELQWKAEQIRISANKLMQLLEKSMIYRYNLPSAEINTSISPEETVVTLPAARTNVPLPKKAKSAGKKLPNVLIVEDNMVNSNLLQHHLKKLCHLFFSQTGKAAIEVAKREKIEAIFMDINLGQGMDGTQAMFEIRKQIGNESLPIVAVTGFATKEDRDRFLKAGFNDFVAKPFERQEVLDIFDKLFSHKD